MGRLAATFPVFFLVVLFTQYVSGCYGAEFPEDEASHYISGLMIHDYILSGFSTSPVGFLKNFHSHYPLVGIGHWGPFFYGIEALWMLVFSTGRASILLLSAVLAAVTALAIQSFAAPRTGRLGAWFAAIAFIVSPIVQLSSSAVMLDIPVALSCLGATLLYVRYVETGRWTFSALFGIVAALAMLIKGNGAMLALLPPFVVWFGRRWDLLRKRSFWLPVPIVGVVVIPWYLATYGMVAAGFRHHWGMEYFLAATTRNAAFLLNAEGPLVPLAALAGAILVCVGPPKHRADIGLTCAAALAASAWVFQSFVPADLQDRYLAPLLPPLFILAAACVASIRSRRWFAARLNGPATAWAAAVIFAVFAVTLLSGAVNAERLPHLGFIEAAREVWKDRTDADPSVLIVADGAGEAAAIAELAMADPNRPSLFVVRGSRLLGAGGYNNADYLPRFRDSAEVIAAIDDYAIPLVLFRADPTAGAWAHLAQVEQARKIDPDCWTPVFRDDQVPAPVTLYELCANRNKRADTAKLARLSGPTALATRGEAAGDRR